MVREVDGQLEVALIRPRGRTLWALPKGHIDPGETAESAALREVCEETGLRTTLEASLGDIRYTYTFRGKRIDKDVQFFLFRWKAGPDAGAIDVLEPAMRVEVDEARWVPLREATSRLAYEGERLMARRAVELLDPRKPRALGHRAEDMLERQGVLSLGPVNLLVRPAEVDPDDAAHTTDAPAVE